MWWCTCYCHDVMIYILLSQCDDVHFIVTMWWCIFYMLLSRCDDVRVIVTVWWCIFCMLLSHIVTMWLCTCYCHNVMMYILYTMVTMWCMFYSSLTALIIHPFYISFLFLHKTLMARNGLLCADVPLRNYYSILTMWWCTCYCHNVMMYILYAIVTMWWCILSRCDGVYQCLFWMTFVIHWINDGISLIDIVNFWQKIGLFFQL